MSPALPAANKAHVSERATKHRHADVPHAAGEQRHGLGLIEATRPPTRSRLLFLVNPAVPDARSETERRFSFVKPKWSGVSVASRVLCDAGRRRRPSRVITLAGNQKWCQVSEPGGSTLQSPLVRRA